MKYTLFIILTSLFATISQAQTILIPLNFDDQRSLTKELSKIHHKYRSEELIDKDLPTWHIIKKYQFGDAHSPFFIHCSEEFWGSSTHGIHDKCEVGFNYQATSSEISVHDGFMPVFAIAEFKNSATTVDFYKTIGNGVSPVVSFNSEEQVYFTHPTTGNKFGAFRLRIECRRDAAYKDFSCQVWAVK